MSQINNRDDPYDRDNHMNNDSEPPLLRDIDNFVVSLFINQQTKFNGFDTQKTWKS